MTKVFVLEECYDYEGCRVMGVYRTFEAARADALKEDQRLGNELKGWRYISNGVWRADPDHLPYFITEWTVE